MFRGIPFLFVLALLAAGCFGGKDSGSSVSPANGESLVLSQSDVGREFTEFDKGSQRLADASPPRDDLGRFGRKGGWKARFRFTGKKTVNGPLVISSLADLFGSESGARKDFELYKQSLTEFESTGGKPVEADHSFGDELFAVTYSQGLPPNTVRYYVIAWREGNVTASINLNGFKLSRRQAFALAEKQDRRIRSAR